MNVQSELSRLIEIGMEYVSRHTEGELCNKPSAEKWSKKEILGHLIDSAINNLQRFTEIQFCDRPYAVRKYDQDKLVIANDYQNADTAQLLQLWSSLNHRILAFIDLQDEITLSYEIRFEDGKVSDLKFLMQDYVAHLGHHLSQLRPV